MVRIKYLASLTGGRDPGTEDDVSESEARSLIAACFAEALQELPPEAQEADQVTEEIPEPVDVFAAAGIDASLAEDLRAGGVTTLQEILDHPDLTDLKGIGKVGASKAIKAAQAAQESEGGEA